MSDQTVARVTRTAQVVTCSMVALGIDLIAAVLLQKTLPELPGPALAASACIIATALTFAVAARMCAAVDAAVSIIRAMAKFRLGDTDEAVRILDKCTDRCRRTRPAKTSAKETR